MSEEQHQRGRIEAVETVVPDDPELVLSPTEREAILEIGYLAIAADRQLRDEELEAFRGVASRLRDLVGDPDVGPSSKAAPSAHGDRAQLAERAALSDHELDALLNRYAEGLARSDADERLRDLAKALTRPDARAVAYKVAYALALCDLDTSDPEFEFDLQLIDSLGLSQEEAEALADQVMEAFAVE